MRRLPISMLAFSILSLFVFSGPAAADWPEGGVPVCVEAGNQYSPKAISDGQGGCYVVWNDYRAGYYEVYLQRLDAGGSELWAPGGIIVSGAGADQYGPAVVSDGEGGVIVAWADYRNTLDNDVYVQKFDGNGTPQWTTDGVLICGAPGNQTDIYMVTDGWGGAVIVWEDNRDSGNDIYAQRIRNSGTVEWLTDGRTVCTASGAQYNLSVAAGDLGDIAVTWIDNRSGQAVYAQNLNQSGYTQWTTDGLIICQASGGRYDPEIEYIGNDHWMIVWEDFRGADIDIYAQTVKPDGTVGWASGGILISGELENEGKPRIVSGMDGSAFIVWWRRDGWYDDIYAQRIDHTGSELWTPGGVLLCDITGDKFDHEVMLDGEGGIIVAFTNYISGSDDIYAQRLDGNGNLLWTSGSELIAEGPGALLDIYSTGSAMDTDGDGGAILAYYTITNDGNNDVYAQRIEKNGYWGDPSPVIRDVRDVPGDEGGYVSLAWDACRADNDGRHLCTRYTVWRAIDQEAALMTIDAGAPMVGSPAELSPEPETGTVRSGILGASAYYWKLVSTVDAYYLDSYSEVAATLFDSTGVSDEHHYFQVIAHTEDPSNFWISAPDSGYSVDNLAPDAPLALAGEQSYSPEGLQLTWDPNNEPDLAGYNIYRGTSEGFLPGTGTFVTSTPDTAVFDGDWDWASGYWYKVAAVDIHGNESVCAVLGSDMITGDDPVTTPEVTFLSQNYPNPFNPNTTIKFGLRERGAVSLRIYDAAGRLLRVLADGVMDAGSHELSWSGDDDSGAIVASGVYFYKLSAKEFTKTRKLVLLR